MKPDSDAEIRLQKYAETERKVNLIVALDPQLHKQLRILAAYQGLPMSEYVRRLIRKEKVPA